MAELPTHLASIRRPDVPRAPHLKSWVRFSCSERAPYAPCTMALVLDRPWTCLLVVAMLLTACRKSISPTLQGDASTPYASAKARERRWSGLALGREHACAWTSKGEAWCWGGNARGAIGIEALDIVEDDRPSRQGMIHTVTRCSFHPVRVGGLAKVRALTAGEAHTCALMEDGSVTCFGQGIYGRLGAPTSRGALYSVVTSAGVAEVDAGGDTTCARLVTGEVTCWGDDSHGQASGLREPHNVHRIKAVTVAGVDAVQIAIDDGRSFARRRDGTVWGWGMAPDGTTGKPAPVSGIANATGIVAGWGGAACAYHADGVPSCWGSVILDQERAESTPIPVPSLANARLTFGGGNHCLLRDGGELACWGYNHEGGTGTGPGTFFRTPRRVDIRAVDVALGADFGCAITADDKIACWGANNLGQLGNGTRTPSFIPVMTRL